VPKPVSFVLAGQNSGEVYTLTVGDTPVFSDGESADASALLDGQTAEVQFDSIENTAPASLCEVQ